MSKVELKGSLASRIGAGALGFILVFSPIVGPVAMAESKTAIVELQNAGFKLSDEQTNALDFIAHLDEYYNKAEAGEKLPKGIVNLLKKYDGDYIFNKIVYTLGGDLAAEEGLKVLEHKRSEYNFVFPGVFFIENEEERKFAEEIQEMHNEVVHHADKKMALEIYSKIVDYFDNGQKKGEYGFRGIIRVIFQANAGYVSNLGWAEKPEFLEAMRNASFACSFNPRMIATIEKIRSDLGIIENYELPVKIYPATREQLDEQAKALETPTPEPVATPTEMGPTPTPEPVVTEIPEIEESKQR